MLLKLEDAIRREDLERSIYWRKQMNRLPKLHRFLLLIYTLVAFLLMVVVFSTPSPGFNLKFDIVHNQVPIGGVNGIVHYQVPIGGVNGTISLGTFGYCIEVPNGRTSCSKRKLNYDYSDSELRVYMNTTIIAKANSTEVVEANLMEIFNANSKMGTYIKGLSLTNTAAFSTALVVLFLHITPYMLNYHYSELRDADSMHARICDNLAILAALFGGAFSMAGLAISVIFIKSSPDLHIQHGGGLYLTLAITISLNLYWVVPLSYRLAKKLKKHIVPSTQPLAVANEKKFKNGYDYE